MSKIKILCTTILLFMLIIGGCVNFKSVNDFASSSLNSVTKYEEINYSFRRSCNDDCRIEYIKKLNYSLDTCDCIADARADSVTMIIYNAIRGYLEGLTNLSNDEVTNYKFEAFSKSLSNINYGSFKIEPPEAEAYSNISGILLKAFTNGYRSSKIKDYIRQANGPIKILTDKLNFILSANLTGKIQNQMDNARFIFTDLMRDKSLSTYEKRQAIKEYFASIEKMQMTKESISTYTKGLKKITEGHQKLYENLDNLNTDELKNQLTEYASEIKDIISEYNKIGK